MNFVKKILVPFDFSEASISALNYAIKFAQTDEIIELELLYVYSGSGNIGNADFKKVIGKYGHRLTNKISGYICDGELVNSVLKHQKEQKFDLIIMGTKGISKKVESTNTTQLVFEADCPVLVVPQGYKKFDLKKIALSIDTNEIDDSKVLKILLDTARRFNANVNVITVSNNATVYPKLNKQNENLIEYYLEKFYSDYSIIRSKSIEAGILDYIKSHNIDMLAILPRNHAKKVTPSKGKLVKRLTEDIDIPLLTLD